MSKIQRKVVFVLFIGVFLTLFSTAAYAQKEVPVTSPAKIESTNSLGTGTVKSEWALDLHYIITNEWALNNGFSSSDAQTIAIADITTDTSLATAGRLADTGIGSKFPYTHDEFHFNMNSNRVEDIGSSNDTRMIKYNQYYNQAVTKYKTATEKYNKYWWYSKSQRNADRIAAFNDLGTSIHCRQDIIAHGNVQTIAQHNSYVMDGEKAIDDLNYNIDFATGKITKYDYRSMSNPRYANTYNVTSQIITSFKNDVQYNPND